MSADLGILSVLFVAIGAIMFSTEFARRIAAGLRKLDFRMRGLALPLVCLTFVIGCGDNAKVNAPGKNDKKATSSESDKKVSSDAKAASETKPTPDKKAAADAQAASDKKATEQKEATASKAVPVTASSSKPAGSSAGSTTGGGVEVPAESGVEETPDEEAPKKDKE